jgi:hypothetical protein
MSDTITYTGSLSVMTCWCGIHHAVPRSLRDFQMRQFNDGGHVTTIYCPLGHQHVPIGETEVDRLRKTAERAKAREARAISRADQAEASLRTTKGVVTKMKKRAAHGVCPCCKRTFANVARHVKGQHPEFVAEQG